jgi:uncharacterized cysteine cluster protein YcgN (CxxCxxCC family)
MRACPFIHVWKYCHSSRNRTRYNPVLACIHKMNLDLFELLPRSCPNTFVMEGIVLMKLIHLQLGCTLPLVVAAIKLVESDGIFISY